MRRLIGVLAFALATSVVMIAAGPAAAEEFTCRRTVGAITVDNLRMPQGALCVLEGTRVKGTIKVETDARLRAKRVEVIERAGCSGRQGSRRRVEDHGRRDLRREQPLPEGRP